MHVKVISPKDVAKVQVALGRVEDRTWATSAEAYEAGLQEDAPNVEVRGGCRLAGRRPSRPPGWGAALFAATGGTTTGISSTSLGWMAITFPPVKPTHEFFDTKP